MSSKQQIDISQLSVGELQQLQQQLSNEVNNFVNSLVALQRTAARFAAAGRSVEGLKDAKEGDTLMLPMTESLYVPGTLKSVETVLLEVGTGYYIEVGIAACSCVTFMCLLYMIFLCREMWTLALTIVEEKLCWSKIGWSSYHRLFSQDGMLCSKLPCISSKKHPRHHKKNIYMY